MSALLEVRDLTIGFRSAEGGFDVAVDGVSFDVGRGELVALVGESGCGKSLTAMALLSLLPDGAACAAGSRVVFDGHDLLTLAPRERRALRGGRIGIVFQDAMNSLNPVLRVGAQVVEAILAHEAISRGEARRRATALLAEVEIGDPDRCLDAWPHQLSGGMRQRVMLAIALAGSPDLLVADEPTTALDVTVQAQVLELLDRLRASRGMSVLLITHDLGIVADRADRTLVMYAGRVVEAAPTEAVVTNARHPYTRALLASRPRLDVATERLPVIPGAVPSPGRWPTGCRFHPRCPLADARCGATSPEVVAVGDRHRVACWRADTAAAP